MARSAPALASLRTAAKVLTDERFMYLAGRLSTCSDTREDESLQVKLCAEAQSLFPAACPSHLGDHCAFPFPIKTVSPLPQMFCVSTAFICVATLPRMLQCTSAEKSNVAQL